MTIYRREALLRPRRSFLSAGTQFIDSNPEDTRSDVVRERAALGQRTAD